MKSATESNRAFLGAGAVPSPPKRDGFNWDFKVYAPNSIQSEEEQGCSQQDSDGMIGEIEEVESDFDSESEDGEDDAGEQDERIAATIDRLRLCNELTKMQTATTSQEDKVKKTATATDGSTTLSREDRIHALRAKCVAGLGEERFKRLYHFLATISEMKKIDEAKDDDGGGGAGEDEVDELVRERMAELAGENGLPFVAKIEFLLALQSNDDEEVWV